VFGLQKLTGSALERYEHCDFISVQPPRYITPGLHPLLLLLVHLDHLLVLPKSQIAFFGMQRLSLESTS